MRLRAAALAALASAALATPAAAAPSLDEYAVSPASSSPAGITAGADGALWFTQSSTNRIGRVTTGGTVSSYSIPTSNSTPWGITAGPDGRTWFAENGSDKIGAVTADGTISEYAVGPGSAPYDVIAGPDGALWFTAASSGKVGRMTVGGSVAQYNTGSSSSTPHGITVGPDGALWFTESAGNKIGRVTTAGDVTEFAVPTPYSQPASIVAGPDGALWFTELAGNKIGRITTDGAITEYAVPTAFSQPSAIGTGPDGNLWFTEQFAGKVGRITTAGVVTELVAPSPWTTLGGLTEGPDGRLWFAETGANKVAAFAAPPDASTGGATGVDSVGAVLGASIAPNGQTVSYRFDYGTTDQYGESTAAQNASGAGTQSVTAPVDGLTASTTYHYRVVAASAGGTVTGADQTFTTAAASSPDGTGPGPDPDPDPDPEPGSGPAGTSAAAALDAGLAVPATITVTAAGKVPVTVTCPAAARNGCHGSIALAPAPRGKARMHGKAVVSSARCARGCRRIGRRRYKLAGGTTKAFPTKLTRAGRRMVKRRGSLRVRITMRTKAAGKTSVKRRTVVLRRSAVHRLRHRKDVLGAPAGPLATTKNASSITETGAKLTGLVKSDGQATSAWFEYGPTADYGSTTAAVPAGSGTSPVSFSARVKSLAPASTYHYRLVASSYGGTSYGDDMSFTTLAPAPPYAVPTTAAGAAVLGETVVVRTGSGAVMVRPRGTGSFVPLDARTPLPVGSTIDARRGTVRLTSVRDASGTRQTAAFRGGIFQVRQRASGMTDLYLRGGNLAACSRDRSAEAPRVMRKLWGRDRGGRFRTHGSHAIATVKGTVWKVVDRCDGTLTRVAEGKVAVRDLVRHRRVLVTAGHSYLARTKR